MRPNTCFVIFALALLFVLAYCGEETILYDDPMVLNYEEFTFIPKTPHANSEVSMVYFGCGYNETSSVEMNETDILVIKKFNGAMKRPCIPEYDTIPFGTLQEGLYQVTLKIIDINPYAQDSVFHTETKTLTILK